MMKYWIKKINEWNNDWKKKEWMDEGMDEIMTEKRKNEWIKNTINQ